MNRHNVETDMVQAKSVLNYKNLSMRNLCGYNRDKKYQIHKLKVVIQPTVVYWCIIESFTGTMQLASTYSSYVATWLVFQKQVDIF